MTATPSFFVNDQRLVGARSIDAFAPVIDAELVRRGREQVIKASFAAP